MGSDFYKLSREISKELTNLGWEDINEEIESIISRGSVGTEILMGLRWTFLQFLEENKESNLSVEIRIKIQNLINEISEILDM